MALLARALALLAVAYWLTVGGGCSSATEATVEVGARSEDRRVTVLLEHEDGSLIPVATAGTGERLPLPPGRYRFSGDAFVVR